MNFLRQAVVGVFLIAAAVVAQTPQRATIEGIAKNLKTGEPLADVRVTVTPEVVPAGLAPAGALPPATATRSATTDAEGRFTITGVLPGRYTLSATRTLFFRPRRNTGAMAVTVAADQRLRGVQILLMPTGVIAGRVVDENREPLRSVRIEALRSEYRNGVRTWLSSGTNTTDDRGEYRVFNLQPGTYYIRASQITGVNPAPMMYYPGVPDSQDASPLQIEAGSELGAIDITIRRVSEYSVQFKVGGAPPGSAVNLTVQKQNNKITEPNILARPTTLPDNTYRIERLAPGAYDIVAQISTPAAIQPRVVTHAGKIPVLIGRSDEDLGTVSVRATVPVTGRIVPADPLESAS
jgi:protocatechuate 3,4-dioxygenase beta subunit